MEIVSIRWKKSEMFYSDYILAPCLRLSLHQVSFSGFWWRRAWPLGGSCASSLKVFLHFWGYSTPTMQRGAVMGQLSIPVLPNLPEDANVGGQTGRLRASTTLVDDRAVFWCIRNPDYSERGPPVFGFTLGPNPASYRLARLDEWRLSEDPPRLQNKNKVEV